MKFLLYIDILIAITVLVKSDETSLRIARQSGYFYDKPKITFEEGNSLSDNKKIRITSSKKPIYTPSTETVIGNDLSFQGDKNNYRIPIISLDSNKDKNKKVSSVRDDFLQYQKVTVKSPQISNTNFPSTSNQFGQRVTTQRSELINDDFNRPSINEEHKKIRFNTGVLQNGQYIKTKEVTPLPTVTSFTQSPFNVYNGGDDEKKINQETFSTVNKKPFPPLKPTVAPVKTISFNDGVSDFELDKTIGTNKIFTSYKPLPSLPSEVPASQIFIKQPQSPQILNTISTERFEGYSNSNPIKPTEISAQKVKPIEPIQTSKSVHYKPTLNPFISSTAQQPKQTISRVKSYEIPKLPSSPLPSYKVPQTSISVAPIFITNNITYTSSRTSSPRPFKLGFTEPSIKKPLSSQPLTYKTGVSVERSSVKVAEAPAFISQSPNYNLDRFSSTPQLPSYQTQKVIASKTPAKPGFQSQFYSPKTSETGKLPLTQSFAGYVYEIPKKTFEEKPSTNPLAKVSSFHAEKTKFPNAINIPYLQTSTFKPQTYTSSIPSSFHQFSKPSKQPFNLKPQQISNIKGPEITTSPNYKPFSGSQIPFQRPAFSTQIPLSTSTYRSTSLPQALKPIKTQSPTSYVYNKPKQTPITKTFTESSSYKPSQSIFNYKLNQNTTPRVPYSYEGQQFQAAFKPLEISSSSRPLNKPLQLPSSDRPAKIPTTDKNFDNFSLQSTQRPFTYEISKSPGYRPSQPILPYKPSQTKNQYKPFQTHIQDRTTQKSTFKSPEILSSLTPSYQPEKIVPHVTFTKTTHSLNYPQTQISNELIKTTNDIKPSQRLPSFPKTQNSPPLYKQSSISPFYGPKTISTYQPQKTFSNTKQPQILTTPNPIKSSFNQQNQIRFHKPSIAQSFNRPIPIQHIHEVSKVSQPQKFPSFSVPSEPPINILSKPILSPEPFLPSVSSSPKPPNPYTAPLSRYPPNKPIFQGPAYIPPLESSSKKPIIYKPSSFKPYIPVSTTEKTSIYAISTYKPYFSTSSTRKPFINTSFTYKIPVSSEKPYTSSKNIPYRPIISTEKPLLYTQSTYKTELSFGTTKKPFIYTGSTFKPYVPVKISQKPYIYETSSVRPFITTTKIKEPFTSTFNNFKPYIPNDTTEKHFSYASSTSKPFVIASTTKKPLIHTYSTKKPYLSEITQKPFIYGPPEYKPKPFVAINDTGKTFDQAFSTRKPYISFTTTQKPQTYAPSPYVTTKRKPFTIASTSPKPFIAVTSSQKPVTYSTYTYKPFVPVSVTQKPYFPVDSTTQSLIYTPSTRKPYVSSKKSEKPFTYATPIYKPFVPIDQSRELSTLKPYKTISTTGKPSSYKTSSPYRPFISISETKSTTAKPLAYTSSSFKPFVAVSSTRKSFTGIPESTTQKPFTYTIASTQKPFVTVSRTQKPSTYAPFSRKPATSTQKSFFYTSSLEPIIVTSTTQKPFIYDTSSYRPFTTSRITYKPFEPIYTTQKSITKISNTEDKSTSQSIFRTTAFGVPTRRPSTQHEDRGYLPPQPAGYFYPKPKIPFNSK
ncbi:hypothetical protein WA026_008204 [Henosepilachna vigintioctopunctata]|uniref:Uncharacterized protein n=1 Tax=Henosepilachna vigintioctopunctata TaxID=420089 RepID=A0AAW1TIQ2_9CUCU